MEKDRWVHLFEVDGQAGLAEWVDAMQLRLAHFVDFRVPNEVTADFSRESLQPLQDWLSYLWGGRNPVNAEQVDVDLIDGAIRYVGETFLRAFGGRWAVYDKDLLYGGQPGVKLDVADTRAGFPLQWLITAVIPDINMNLTSLFDFFAERMAQSGRARPAPASARRRGQVLAPEVQASTDKWIAQVPALVTEAQDRFPELNLDFSREALARLQAHLPGMLPVVDMTDPGTHHLLDVLAAYTGETFRRQHGGEWFRGLGPRDDPEEQAGAPHVGLYYPRQDMHFQKNMFIAVYLVISGEHPDSMTRGFDIWKRQPLPD